MEIDPRRLRVLLAIARTGGVLAAADELKITASAASQQLNKLEEETGHALVVRTRKGSTLTPAGLALAEAAEEIERALNVARARMDGGADLAGIVRVGGFTSFLRSVVSPCLPEWRDRFPQLQVRIFEDDDLSASMRLLRQHELDAVVVEIDSSAGEPGGLPAKMYEEPLLDEPWKLVVPSGSVLTTDTVDFARIPLPWLGVQPETASASAMERLRRTTGAQGGTVHQYKDTLTALALVAAGEGVAVLPALALNGIVQTGVDILDVPGLGMRRIVLRRFDRGRSVSTPMDTVARLFREAVAALDPPLAGARRPALPRPTERRRPLRSPHP